jgi:hypothetical protein
VLQWLLAQSVGMEASDRIRTGTEFMYLFLDAAVKGYTEVMESLYRHQLTGDVVLAIGVAAEKGQLNSIKWLLDHYPIEQLRRHGRVLDKAAEYGHVEILQFFHDLDAAGFEGGGFKRRKKNSWWSYAEDPIYWAARGGHLAVLEWIQANKTQQCRVDAMDEAAGQGHLEVVKWLHTNRSEGCTSCAMDNAADNGHLEMVKWLHGNRSEGCTHRAMYLAAEHGHLEVVKWLYAHRPDSHTHRAIDAAVQSGHIRILCWLQPLFPDYKIGTDFPWYQSLVGVNGSWESGKTFEMLLCLRVRYRYLFTPRFLGNLRSDLLRVGRFNPQLLRGVETWLDEYYPSN